MKRRSKIKPKSKTLADTHYCGSSAEAQNGLDPAVSSDRALDVNQGDSAVSATSDVTANDVEEYTREVFSSWDQIAFEPDDFEVGVPADSLESRVGYTSLIRQMHRAFVRTVAFYRSEAGGSLSIEEARARAFSPASEPEGAMIELEQLLRLPVESLNFVDIMELHSAAPRVAERFWEHVKAEARKEFESGHLSANICFPVGYMKQVWNIARYLGVRESFVAEWNPRGGIEVSMVDMLAQSYFQWQYWLEQTVKRSEARPYELQPDYLKWLDTRFPHSKSKGIEHGYWHKPLVTDQSALENAVQMADRFNRIFMRTLRQLRDLRRYSSVIINNANQVNIGSECNNQMNLRPDQCEQ